MSCGELVLKRRLPDWMILAGGTAVAAAAFFGSTGITHWVMGLQRTDVVVRPGPTVYVTTPAGHGHAHDRALPAPAPAGAAHGGSMPSRQAAHARPDQRGRRPQGFGPGAAHHRGGPGVGHPHGH
jgi:hypothetical protein